MTSAQVLYRLWDDAGYLLYVGITADVVHRVGEHLTRQPWAWQVCGFTTEDYPSRPAVLLAETEAIRAEVPRYNIRKAAPAPMWSEPEPTEDLDALRLARITEWQSAARDEFPPEVIRGYIRRWGEAEDRHAAWTEAGGTPNRRDPTAAIWGNVGALLAPTEHTYQRGPTMTACATCSSEIPAGAEVYVATEGDALAGPMTFLCRECADTDPRTSWAEPHLPTEDTLPECPPSGEAGAEDTLPEDPPGPVIGGQDPPGDTYNREQAGKVLGVSARRVSQLAAEGRLAVVQESPLRVSAESVHVLRAERRGPGRDTRATVPPDPSADVAAQVERVVSLVVAEHRKAIEAGESLLAEVTAQRDDYRAEAERLRAEVEAERVARAEAERLRAEAAERPRRWWRR